MLADRRLGASQLASITGTRANVWLLTILEIIIFGLTPGIQLLAVRMGVASDVIKVEREPLLRRDDLLHWRY